MATARKAIFALTVVGVISCAEGDDGRLEPDPVAQPSCINVVTDAYGRKYPSLEPPSSQYCGPGWGRKMCRFLRKYDGTKWVDVGNGDNHLPDVSFSNFSGSPYFISFFSLDTSVAMCRGWKLGESNTADGANYTIDIRQDDEEVFSFVFRYYGLGNSLQYTTVYKYEVRDGLLYFSSSDGRQGTYRPSERSYFKDSLGIREVVKREGCFF